MDRKRSNDLKTWRFHVTILVFQLCPTYEQSQTISLVPSLHVQNRYSRGENVSYHEKIFVTKRILHPPSSPHRHPHNPLLAPLYLATHTPLLPHPPSMPHQILNHTLKRLLLPHTLIPPLQPILQHLARPARHLLQPRHMHP